MSRKNYERSGHVEGQKKDCMLGASFNRKVTPYGTERGNPTQSDESSVTGLNQTTIETMKGSGPFFEKSRSIHRVKEWPKGLANDTRKRITQRVALQTSS